MVFAGRPSPLPAPPACIQGIRWPNCNDNHPSLEKQPALANMAKETDRNKAEIVCNLKPSVDLATYHLMSRQIDQLRCLSQLRAERGKVGDKKAVEMMNPKFL